MNYIKWMIVEHFSWVKTILGGFLSIFIYLDTWKTIGLIMDVGGFLFAFTSIIAYIGPAYGGDIILKSFFIKFLTIGILGHLLWTYCIYLEKKEPKK